MPMWITSNSARFKPTVRCAASSSLAGRSSQPITTLCLPFESSSVVRPRDSPISLRIGGENSRSSSNLVIAVFSDLMLRLTLPRIPSVPNKFNAIESPMHRRFSMNSGNCHIWPYDTIWAQYGPWISYGITAQLAVFTKYGTKFA